MTKKEQLKECQRILHSGVKVVSDSKDFDFLMSVFSQHTHWEKKCLSQRIIKIEIKKSNSGTNCFHIVREDGTMSKISMKHCIYPRSKKKIVSDACRFAIKKIKEEFINNAVFPMICPINHIEIKSKNEADVDHYDLTFDELFEEWVKTKDGGIDFLFENTNETSDTDSRTFFISQELNEDFIKFHNNNTHLRIVCRNANRSTLKRKK